MSLVVSLVVSLAVSSIVAGCASDDEAATTTTVPIPGVPDELVGEPLLGAVDESPFCRTMLEVGADDFEVF